MENITINKSSDIPELMERFKNSYEDYCELKIKTDYLISELANNLTLLERDEDGWAIDFKEYSYLKTELRLLKAHSSAINIRLGLLKSKNSKDANAKLQQSIKDRKELEGQQKMERMILNEEREKRRERLFVNIAQ